MVVNAESAVQLAGPWSHRTVSANGSRFHIAEAGDGPLVLMLHGFPEFWWTWRHQLTWLPEAGFRAVAVDLRGYGGSDKPPRGYDLITAAADAAGLIRALGEANAVVVGHGWGGLVAWTLGVYYPKVAGRLAVVSTAHPLRMRSAMVTDPLGQGRHSGYALGFQVPMLPERQLARPRDRAGLRPRHADPLGGPLGAGVPPLAGAQHRAPGRPALRPADAYAYPGPDAAPARGAGPLRAAADRTRGRPVRGRPLPLAPDLRRRALPARGTPGGLRHRAARLAGRPGTGTVRPDRDRDRDPGGRPRNARPRDALGRPLDRAGAGAGAETAAGAGAGAGAE